MFVTAPKRKGGITVVRLVRGYRINGKVRQEIIKTVGQSKDPQMIEYYKKIALNIKAEMETKQKQEPIPLPLTTSLCYLEGRDAINDGIPDILGFIYDQLGLNEIISNTRKDREWNKVLKYCVLARYVEPSSKRRSIQVMLDRFEMQSSHSQILRMMDHLSEREEEIKAKLSRKMIDKSQALDIMLFDVTTLYFENTNVTDLKNFGFSKDSKFKEVQVVLALLTDSDGLPISYEVFPGNTAETKTFIHCLEKIKKKYKLNKIRVTADKAMFSKKNFSYFEDKEDHGERSMEYIISCPLRKMTKKLQEEVLNLNNYNAIDEDRSVFEFCNDGRRVVAVYSQKRAAHDAYKREKILSVIEKLKGKDGTIDTKKLTQNRGIGRFLEKSKGSVAVNKKIIEEDRKWDGIAGLCTNIEEATPKELLSSYRRLWKIEESFRINKHTLKMRPIFHRLSKRIKIHIMICFLSYIVLRYTELLLRSQGLHYGPEEFLNILSGIERWVLRDKTNGKLYVIPKSNSKEGREIYKALKLERKELAYMA